MFKYDGDKKLSIREFDCADTKGYKDYKDIEKKYLENQQKIEKLHRKLYAEKKEGLIILIQAMDAAGKDGAVRSALGPLSPPGLTEYSFKTPTPEETRHDFLWRFWKTLPEKGCISIFNRSYYEDVLCQKIHKYYENYNFADRIDRRRIIDKRYSQIKQFEEYLYDTSTRIVKIFLHISKREQALRLVSRIDSPSKHWKVSAGDVAERKYWEDYMDAFETAINKTATRHCPWYVIPADNKWFARYAVTEIVLDTLKDMAPDYPEADEEEKKGFDDLRRILVEEEGLTKEETDLRVEK